jgi:hypothetical protein
MDKILAANNWRKEISGAPYGGRKRVLLEVKAKLYKHSGNDYAYYSITGTISRQDKRYRDPVITGGAIHEDILEHYPELAPLVSVHLSAPDGVPMYAEANARYWAGLCKYPDGSPMGEFKPLMLAKHLRVSVELAKDIRAAMAQGLPWDTITAHTKLLDLWSEQAGKARSLLKDYANA